jgi:hypothetical protein
MRKREHFKIRKYARARANQQKETFRRVLSLVGSVSIYYSTMVAMFNLLMYQNVGLLTNIVALSILSFPITVVYRRERQSRRLAEKLAISLEDTRWLRRYEGQRKRKERRLKKARARRPCQTSCLYNQLVLIKET